MIKLKDLVKEKISVKGGKYLDLGGGSITSLPGPYDRDAVAFRNNRGDALVYRDNKGIYADINNRSDERFKDLKQLVNWLNKNNYRYVGIDDR